MPGGIEGLLQQRQAWRFAFDRGGIFTDVVALTPGGRLVTQKLLSEDPGRHDDAVGEAVRCLMAEHGEGPIADIRIGTTVATNALLERKGARVALAIARGFAAALRIGSGGVGAHRGGDGIERRVTFLEPMQASILANRRPVPPRGIAGGGDAGGGENRVERRDGSVEALNATGSAEMQAGDTFVIPMPGGGGFGRAS